MRSIRSIGKTESQEQKHIDFENLVTEPVSFVHSMSIPYAHPVILELREEKFKLLTSLLCQSKIPFIEDHSGKRLDTCSDGPDSELSIKSVTFIIVTIERNEGKLRNTVEKGFTVRRSLSLKIGLPCLDVTVYCLNIWIHCLVQWREQRTLRVSLHFSI